MANATLQLNQILGNDGALLLAIKKGGLNTAGLVAAAASKEQAAFQNFLSTLLKARTANAADAAQILGNTSPATAKKPGGIDLSALPLPAETIAALKVLSPSELQGIAPELAVLAALPAAGGDTPLDSKTLGILDALSALGNAEDGSPDMFTLIDDPELADMLAGIAAQVAAVLQARRTQGENVVLPAPVTAVLQPVAEPGVTRAATAAIETHVDALSDSTLTIADLNGDEFQALKKLFFADIAPYLTAPRTVRIDNGTVMKVAQGPTFLNEESGEIISVLPASILAPALPADKTGDTAAAATTITIEAIILAVRTAAANPAAHAAKNAGAASLPAAGVAASAIPAPRAPGGLASFAAFLGMAANASVNAPVTATPGTTPVFTPTGTATPAPVPAAGQTVAATAPAIATAALPAQGIPASSASAVPAGTPAPADHVLPNLTGGETLGEDLDLFLRVHADQNTAGGSANALTAAPRAGAPHPASHLVSVTMQRVVAENPALAGTDRQFVIQLDPPNLGRLKITLEFGANNTVKAKLLAERPETVSMLQRDAALLERTLNNSGLDTSAPDSVTFDLADGESFSGFMGGNGSQDGSENQSASEDGTDHASLETVMPIFVDPETGLTHVNIVI